MEPFEGQQPPVNPARRVPVPVSRAAEEPAGPLTASATEPIVVDVGRQAGPDLGGPLSMAGLVRAFKHRWLLAASAGLLLCGVFAGAAWVLVPPKYTAYALLTVDEAEPQLLPDGRGVPSPAVERYFENTQVALIKSRPIILAALGRPGISELGMVREHQPEAATWLEENLKVGFLEKTNILRVALDGTNAEELAKLVTAIEQAYMENAVEKRRKEQQAALLDLDGVIQGQREKVTNRRRELRRTAEQLQTSDKDALSFKQKAVLDTYAVLVKELTEVESKLGNAQAALSLLPQNDDGDRRTVKVLTPASNSVVEQAVEADAVVVQKRMELAQFDVHLKKLRTQATPEEPTRARAEQQYKALADELAEVRAARRAQLEQQFRDRTREENEAKRRHARQEVAVLTEQGNSLRKKVEAALNQANAMGISSIDLELKRKEVDASETVLKRLTDERNRLEAELQSTKQRIAVLYAPEPPRRLNLAVQARVVGFAAFLGLFGGAFGVCWWEARKRRVLNKQEIVSGLGCRVMGELPWVRGGAARGRGTGADPSLLLNEAVHGLRAMLLCEAEDQTSGRVLMVTSAVAQEGKTTLASHLAASFAEAGRRTLLLDCDFRRPQLHHVFELPAGPGLQEVLSGQVAAADATRSGPVDGLSVMTAGETTQRVSHAQMLDGLRTLLDELRQRYDFIVVDCCPVLPVADALFIGKRADGVLLSIRPRLSQLPQVYEAFERLSSMNIPVKGAVLNGVRDVASAYEYGYALQQGS